MRRVQAQLSSEARRFAIVSSRWNEAIVKLLVEGAIDELERHGSCDIEWIEVPGAWEIPLVASRLVARTEAERPNAIIALGCVLQGATSHAQMLGHDVGAGLMRIQTDSGVPISWGILTPESAEQAMERSGLKLGNKGREAALAAIEMAGLIEKL